MNKNPLSVWGVIQLKVVFFGFALIILSACNNQPADIEPGQALVRVDGKEITVVQLNDELNRVNIQPDQVDLAKKQLLETMIDRQLMVAEAKRNKLDRAPNVMRAIERAKMHVIAQSYMQTILNKIENPSEPEINQFYQDNPELFAQRKKYTLSFLRFPSNNHDSELPSFIDSIKSLDEVTHWLDKHQISYLRDRMVRTTSDVSPPIRERLQKTDIGDMFLVDENANKMIVLIDNIEDDSVSIEEISPQIAAYLLNNKRREIAQATLVQLRSAADIEYLHNNVATETEMVEQPSGTPSMIDLNDLPQDNLLLQEESIERGLDGLK